MARKIAEIKVEKPDEDRLDKPLSAYFLSLTVENVRCFGPEQTLDLSDGQGRPAQWTIILGDNGVGKTTLLQSFVALLPVPVKDGPPSDRERYVMSRFLAHDWLIPKWKPFRQGSESKF